MTNIFSSNFLSRKPVEKAMKKFANNFNSDMKVLDIGCGNKPYESYFDCEYVGLDPFEDTKADVVADAWDIPLPDNEFDGIILNQSLEHIKKTNETISEIKRVLKPGGLCIITVPQAMKNHSIPVPSKEIELSNFNKEEIRYWNNDFYRFTKFGLLYLFRDFDVLELKETSGYFGTISQLINYFFTSLAQIRPIFYPIFFVSNVIGYTLDIAFSLLNATNIKIFKKFYELIYLSLALNYILIIKKNEK